MKATEINQTKERISLRNIAILCSPNLVYNNDEVVILNYEGFTVTIEHPKNDMRNCVCVVTLMYKQAGKYEKDTFLMQSLIQLTRWLERINNHSKTMYLLGYCEKVEKIPQALEREPFYLLARLNDVMNDE